MFFEGIRSARQLETVGADRLSVRWYLGYDLHQPLPDHSSMTRIRDRYDIAVFRQFFETIVARCQATGLVVGQALYADGTLVEANADRDAMVPRFAVEAYLQHLFDAAYTPPAEGGPGQPGPEPPPGPVATAKAAALAQVERLRRQVRARQRKPPVDDPIIRRRFPPTLPPPAAAPPPTALDPPPAPPVPVVESPTLAPTPDRDPAPELRPDLVPAVRVELAAHNQQRHDWFAHNGAPDRTVQRGDYQRVSNFWVSTTDPDATLMRVPGQGVRLRYRTHYLVDGGPARIILQVLTTPSDVKENTVFLDLLWRTCFRWQLRPRSVTGDTTHGTLEIIKAVEDAGIRAYLPLTDREPPPRGLANRLSAMTRSPISMSVPRGPCSPTATICTPSNVTSIRPTPPRVSAVRSKLTVPQARTAGSFGSCGVLMRPIWSGCGPTIKPQTISRSIRNARWWWNPCLGKPRRGTGCGGLGCGACPR